MNKLICTILSLCLFNVVLQAQDLRLHVNANEVYTFGNNELGYYPILWYSSNTEKVLVGGFGLGISSSKSLSENFSLRAQINLQRSRFYDSPVPFNDANGQAIGAFFGVNTNYSANLFGLPILHFGSTRNWGLAIGLGARIMISTRSNYGVAAINGEITDLKFKRRAHAPISVFVPFRFQYASGRWLFETGIDLDITDSNRLNGVTERYLIWQSGIAIALSKTKGKD